MSVWRALKLLLTLHCDESTRLQSEAFERRLSRVERWALRLHFLSCRACRRFRRQLALIQQAARQRGKASQNIKLPRQLRDQILRKLR